MEDLHGGARALADLTPTYTDHTLRSVAEELLLVREGCEA